MNTPARDDDDDQRCAEYALGVLDAQERAALEADVSRDPALQRALDDWQQRFAPLADDVRAIAPPERVWTRIRRDLGFMTPQKRADKALVGQPERVALAHDRRERRRARAARRDLHLAAASRRKRRRRPQPCRANIMVATIARKDGVVHWTATVDLRRRAHGRRAHVARDDARESRDGTVAHPAEREADRARRLPVPIVPRR